MGWASSIKGLRRSAWYRAAVAFVFAFILAVLAGFAHHAGIFGLFREQLSDRAFPRGTTDPRIAIVAIDDETLDSVAAHWPWPRDLQAELVRRLVEARPEAVILDIVPDLPSPGDDQFAAAMSGQPVALGLNVDEIDFPENPRRATRAVGGLRLPAPQLAEAAATLGMANIAPGRDGVVRTVPLMVEGETVDVPSLALASYMLIEDLQGPITQRPFGIEVGGKVIPTDDYKLFPINFSPELSPGEDTNLRDSTGVPVVPAARVMSGEVSADLEGKIVLVGATAQLLQDFRQTPVAKQRLGLPGVFIHANALNTLLTEEYVEYASTGETVTWVFVLGGLIAILAWLTPLRFGATLPVVLLVGWLVWSLARFEAGVIPDLLYPPMAALLALMFGLVMRYLTEGRARRRVSALFSQYVPPSVANRLMNEDRVEAVMQGERLEASVLFCDLRGFTAQAATMEPGQVRLMLDTYYERLSEMVLDHGGTVMQYVGDEIYAAFGAPEPQDDHAARALACAIQMQKARPALGQELVDMGLKPIFYGIGVNCGGAVSAIVGSSKKSQYSLVGDTVNIGSRLCSQAREDQVCFPDHLREAAQAAVPDEIDDLGPIEFKNATRPIRVWRYWANRDDPDSPHNKAKKATATAG